MVLNFSTPTDFRQAHTDSSFWAGFEAIPETVPPGMVMGGCSKLAWSKNWGSSWTFCGHCSYQAQRWTLQQQLSNSFRDKVRATAWYMQVLYSGLRMPLDSCRIPRQKSYVLIACKPGVALKLLPPYSPTIYL